MMFVFILGASFVLPFFVMLWMKGLLSFLMLTVMLFVAFALLDQPKKKKGKK